MAFLRIAPLRRTLLPQRLSTYSISFGMSRIRGIWSSRVDTLLLRTNNNGATVVRSFQAAAAASLGNNNTRTPFMIQSIPLEKTPSLFYSRTLRMFSNEAASTIDTSNDAAPGQASYQEYLDTMSQIQEALEAQERTKSEKMYKAWERAQEKQTNQQTSGVAVVRTLVKQTHKNKAAAGKEQAALQEQAARLLRQAATQGHAVANVKLGNTSLQQAVDVFKKPGAVTDSSKESLDKAMASYETAGELGAEEGWFNLGNLWWTGFPEHADENVLLEVNQSKAMEAFYKAVDLGDADAMYFVGVQLLDAPEDEDIADLLTEKQQKDLHSGFTLIEQAAGQGHGGALYYTALLHLNGHAALGIAPCAPADFTTRLDDAATAGDADALFLRGHCFYQGDNGYPADYRKALDDFLLASDAGNADAAVSAGAMLHKGCPGVARNQKHAFELYQHAGELGSVEGWRNVVACYLTGEGVPRSKETAKYIAETMLKDNSDD